MEELITRYPELSVCKEDIENAISTITGSYKNGGKLLLCGNGGSSADCDHIVGELMKGFISLRPISDCKKQEMKNKNPRLTDDDLFKLQLAVPAISLSSITGLNTAFCNDVDPKYVFAQSLMGLGKKEDVVMCISTSGNSENCVICANVAKGLGLKVIALTGKSGGKLKEIADVCICAPQTETYMVQELHLPIYHYICMEIEKRYIK